MVSKDLREAVLRRDGYRCQAQVIDPSHAGWCRDAFGNPIIAIFRRDPGPTYLQMSHTKSADELSMSLKAPDMERHLLSLCPGHHTGTVAGSNWEAVHRGDIRKHLGI